MDEQAAFLGRLARGFTAAWREVGADGDGTAAVTDLGARYSESHRHYHTLQHVSSVLEALDAHVGELEHPQEGVLAVWHHDAVYDPAASDNEGNSTLAAQLDSKDVAAAFLCCGHLN